MVAFGLILLLVALAVVAYVWLATRGMEPVQITYGVLNVELTPIWLFIVGGITLAAATCGIWLLAVGMRSQARKAKEVRALRRQAKDSGQTTGSGQGGSTTGRGGSAGGTSTTAERGTSSSDAPILPRTSGGAGGASGGTSAGGASHTTGGTTGTTGTTGGQSSLDLDR